METTEIGPARSRRLLESREWRDDGWGDRGGADDSPLLTQREVAWTPPPRRFSTTARGEIGAEWEKVMVVKLLIYYSVKLLHYSWFPRGAVILLIFYCY